MVIRELTLRRFRQFEDFTWTPSPGLNCIVGAGDAGKTTILEAISRAVSPAPSGTASEHDYQHRRTETGFEVELVIGNLTSALLGAFRPPALWGWRGVGKELRNAPLEDSEPVLRVVMRGTPDLEIEHRVIAPDGSELFFSADKRRLLGLCRVGDSRGSAREFRMARGSLLERTLGREEVKGAAANAMKDASTNLQLPDEVNAQLTRLGKLLKSDGVATEDVTLEVLSPPGQSLLGLLGLALGIRGEAIALSYAGQGTQRLASFLLARELAQRPALVVIDELEVGLEPYRRRLLVQQLRRLLEDGGQAFITTHSSTVLDEVEIAEVHRLAWHPKGGVPATFVPKLTRLADGLEKTKTADSESLLSRLPIVVEGQTERELLAVLLEKAASVDGYSVAALGIRLVDGGGQPNAFDIIDGFSDAGFQLATFLDNEPDMDGRRDERARRENVTAGAWTGATCTEDALAQQLPLEQLEQLFDVGDDEDSRLGTSRRQQLGAALGEPGVVSIPGLAHLDETVVRAAWGETAHKKSWFKKRHLAQALAAWLGDGRLPGAMTVDVAAFWGGILPRVTPPRLELDRDADDDSADA